MQPTYNSLSLHKYIPEIDKYVQRGPLTMLFALLNISRVQYECCEVSHITLASFLRIRMPHTARWRDYKAIQQQESRTFVKETQFTDNIFQRLP